LGGRALIIMPFFNENKQDFWKKNHETARSLSQASDDKLFFLPTTSLGCALIPVSDG
jgi:hypothetical protein